MQKLYALEDKWDPKTIWKKIKYNRHLTGVLHSVPYSSELASQSDIYCQDYTKHTVVTTYSSKYLLSSTHSKIAFKSWEALKIAQLG